MILAIDGYEANVPHRVGSGRYAYELMVHLYSLLRSIQERSNSSVSVRIYLPSPPLADFPPQTPWWRYRIVKPSRLWTMIALPLALATDAPRAHMIFSPTHYIPRFTSVPRVMAIMDLSYLHYPELFRAKDLYQLVHWTSYSAKHAEKIITISEFSRHAIITTYQVPENRVVVVYPGFTMLEQKRHAHHDIFKKYSLKKNYILSVGTLQPRKNYVRLIEAFALALKGQELAENVELVIVGKKGWLYEEILQAPKMYGVTDRVRFLDFVPDEDLPDLYKHAYCFALPSLYEGFGLPVLEAMAYQCPVVVSDTSSLPEIAGDAGIYVHPEDVKHISQGLVRAMRERNAPEGKQRIKAGLERVKKFTWDRAAEQTLRILEEAGGKSS